MEMKQVNVPAVGYEPEKKADEQGEVVSWDEAKQFDLTQGKYFTAEANIEYRLTFSTWALLKKHVQDYRNKEETVEKVVLELRVSSINGQATNQTWSVLSPKLREMFEPYAKSGSILKKTFYYKHNGLVGKDRRYSLSTPE